MDCAMIRSISSEASTCSDYSSPVTPVFNPQLDGLQIERDIDIQLTPRKGIDRGIFTTLKEFSVTSDSPEVLGLPAVRRICFIGAGYVGGPTAAVMALHNPWLRVDVVDKNELRIEQWQSRHLPIHEPGLDHIVRLVRDGSQDMSATSVPGYEQSTLHKKKRAANLFFSTDVVSCVSQADIIFLAINTPTKTFGRGAGRATNMSAFDACIDEIIPHVKMRAIVVEKSTVPCGTANRIVSKFRARRPNIHIEVLSNPEFLSEGTAIQDLMKPDRVVIGNSRTMSGYLAAEALSGTYSWVPRNRIITSNTWSSELSKLVANAILAQRISSINSVSAICEEIGADISEVSAVIGRDPRIGSRFIQSGLGFGGSCFRKDIASLTYLAKTLGLDEVADYWESVNSLNYFQRRRFANRCISKLDENLTRKKIAILGFAFKKGTADCRESLATDIVHMLLDEGAGEVAIFDPLCSLNDIRQEILTAVVDEQLVLNTVKVYADPYAACMKSDAILIVTDCDQFKITSKHQSQQRQFVNEKDDSRHSSLAPETIFVTTNDAFTATEATQEYTLVPPPSCTDESCRECGNKSPVDATLNKKDIWASPSARLHWPTIAENLKPLACIFDARHVLDREAVEELRQDIPEFTVEWIGVKP